MPDLNPPTQASSVPGPEPVCLRDLEPLAKAKMSAMGWDYINSGAADEHTLRWNEEVYQRIRLKPHVLVDVSKLDTRVVLFGHEHSFPILLAPTASQQLTHPEGELATVRGAGAADTMALTGRSKIGSIDRSVLWL